MKNLFLKLCFLLLIPGLMAFTNLLVDPANIFHKKYVIGIVELLLDGKNVANITNCNQRVLNRYFLEKYKKPVENIVLGSSRTLELHANDFPYSANYLNISVPSAFIEDYMAFYEMLKSRKMVPKKMLINLDPWLLRNPASTPRQWMDLLFYYQKALSRMGLSERSYLQASKLRELFNPDYFKQSLKHLRNFKNRYDYYAISSGSEKILDVPVWFADGSMNYDLVYHAKSEIEVEQEVKKYNFRKAGYSLLGSNETLDKNEKNKFEKFLDLLIADGVSVELFLIPYHPITFKSFSQFKQYSIVFEAEKYFIDLAQQKNISLFGSYNPQKAGFVASDFYDEMHVKAAFLIACLKRNQSTFFRGLINPPNNLMSKH